jgi:ribosomal-protein-alanine N-acetyltransferase
VRSLAIRLGLRRSAKDKYFKRLFDMLEKCVKINFAKINVKTKRLVIRPLQASDYQAWLRGYTGRKPKQHKYDVGPTNPKETPKKWFLKLIRRHRKIAKEDKVFVFGVFHRKTKEHIGSLDFATIQRYNMSWANLGYLVHNTHQGQGYAKEFVKAAIDKIGYKKLGYNRIEAAINVDNKRSVKLAKSVGLKRECIRPKFFFENGTWTDHVIYTAISS